MGLESATYISELTASNPASSDAKAQGDDHLRLLKSVLQSTFPNADKAFRLPDSVNKTANYTVLAADMNKLITGDASGGAFNLTLPTLGASDDGWGLWVIKTDSSTNAVTLVGTINGVSNLAITIQYSAVRVFWTGSAWLAVAAPPLIPLALTLLNITGGTAETAPAVADLLAIYDASAAANRKMTLENMLTVLNVLTAETSVAFANDLLLLYDASANAVRKMTVQNVLKGQNVPSVQRLTSGSGATYTTPANCRKIVVKMIGGGGGGGAGSTNAGSAGGTTSFESWSAGGGAGGSTSNTTPGAGGTGGGTGAGTLIRRMDGTRGGVSSSINGGGGGGSPFSPMPPLERSSQAGTAGPANSGAGGGGGSSGAGAAGSGGGSGEYVEFYIDSPGASYTYTIGAGGSGGAAGGSPGGNGGSGVVEVWEYY